MCYSESYTSLIQYIDSLKVTQSVGLHNLSPATATVQCKIASLIKIYETILEETLIRIET